MNGFTIGIGGFQCHCNMKYDSNHICHINYHNTAVKTERNILQGNSPRLDFLLIYEWVLTNTRNNRETHYTHTRTHNVNEKSQILFRLACIWHLNIMTFIINLLQ